MARERAPKQYLNFVGGLHSEAGPLSFPENVAKDLDNVDLNRDGSVRRRRGIDFEPDAPLREATTAERSITPQPEWAITVHEWRGAGEDSTVDFTVIQIGGVLYFHQLGSNTMAQDFTGSVDLSEVALEEVLPSEAIGEERPVFEFEKHPVDTAVGRGRLYVVGRYLEPSYITYNANDDEFTITKIDVKIRDLDGVDDGLAVDHRPTTLSSAHRYNLRNQGWPHRAWATAIGGSGITRVDPILHTRNAIGVYPSNADIIYLARMTSSRRPVQIGVYSAGQLDSYAWGNTPAPKGHFILNAFIRARPIVFFHNGPDDWDNFRPISNAFYAGRIWYLMHDGRVLFSQMMKTMDDVGNSGKCYQEADPTAEDINELIATDGGMITLSDVVNAKKMVALQNELLIFAENGVWSVAGSGEDAFTATSQSVRKVTNAGCISADSVVVVESVCFYFSDAGIFMMQQDEISGRYQAQSISEQTVQTFYEENIPEISKSFARGKYDSHKKKIIWLYNDTEGYDGLTYPYLYNKALIFDFSIGAFYKYSFPFDLNEGVPAISGFVDQSNSLFSIQFEDADVVIEDDIFVEPENFEITNQWEVYANQTTAQRDAQIIKYYYLESQDRVLINIAPGSRTNSNDPNIGLHLQYSDDAGDTWNQVNYFVDGVLLEPFLSIDDNPRVATVIKNENTGHFLGVGANALTDQVGAKVWNSPDGVNWHGVDVEEHSTSGIGSITGPALYANGQYIAVTVDSGAAAGVSPDGVSWDVQVLPNSPTIVRDPTFCHRRLAYSPDENRVILIAEGSSGVQVWYLDAPSPTGNTWNVATPTGLGNVSTTGLSLIYSESLELFVLAYSDLNLSADSRKCIATSSDGLAWTVTFNPTDSDGLVWDTNLSEPTGVGRLMITRNHPTGGLWWLYTSTDAVNWDTSAISSEPPRRGKMESVWLNRLAGVNASLTNPVMRISDGPISGLMSINVLVDDDQVVARTFNITSRLGEVSLKALTFVLP